MALLSLPCTPLYLELVKGDADINLLKVPRKVRLLRPLVLEGIAAADRPRGAAEDKLEVLKPAQSRTN